MGASESNLWAWLSGARGVLGPALKMRRVENVVSTGDPDVDGVLRGSPFDLELKAGKRPARPSTVVRHETVKLAQIEYGEEMLAAGGAHAFLIQVGSGHERRFFVVPGYLGRWLEPFRTEAELAEVGTEVYSPVDAIEKTIALKERAYEY